MSVRDYEKIYHIKNMTTGELFCSIPFDNFDRYSDNYLTDVSIDVPIGDVRILNAIHECLENNHGCLISIGYKAE